MQRVAKAECRYAQCRSAKSDLAINASDSIRSSSTADGRCIFLPRLSFHSTDLIRTKTEMWSKIVFVFVFG